MGVGALHEVDGGTFRTGRISRYPLLLPIHPPCGSNRKLPFPPYPVAQGIGLPSPRCVAATWKAYVRKGTLALMPTMPFPFNTD